MHSVPTTHLNQSIDSTPSAPSNGIGVFPGAIALYHGPLLHTDHGYETYRPYADYIAEFAKHFKQVVVLAPVTREDTAYRGATINTPNVRIVELPSFDTHLQAMKHATKIIAIFRHELHNFDVINCRNTAPLGAVLFWLARKHNIGFYYEFMSDPWEILKVGTKYKGLYGLFAKSAYLCAFQAQKWVMRRSYSFIDGLGQYENLRNVTDRMEPLIISTLEADDFRERAPDAALHSPIRLLYVGYLKHMKGLEYLIEAIGILKKEGVQVELSFAGDGPQAAELKAQADQLNVTSRVRFHGHVAERQELHERFDEADIFVFPSLSEGSPRVILEAMARSLPIVSTPVGTVPLLINDGQSGLLVPFRDPAAIAKAITRLISEQDLRRECMHAAYNTARQHTLARYVGRLAEKAKELARRPTNKP